MLKRRFSVPEGSATETKGARRKLKDKAFAAFPPALAPDQAIPLV
jgi:hypothetical protein